MQGSVSGKMEGRAGVLKAEIKQDASFGTDTTAKEEELAEAEQLAAKAAASQMGTLRKANEEMKEAAKADSGADKTSSTSEAKEDKKDKKAAGEETDEKQGQENMPVKEAGSGVQEKPANYTSIDICL